MKLPIDEFIRRFFLHVLPKGFVRIRYYGFLATSARDQLRACMLSLGRQMPLVKEEEKKSWDEAAIELTGIDPLLCPCCKKGRLKLRRTIDPRDMRREVSTKVA